MDRRIFLGMALSALALPATAQQSVLSVPAGTPVLTNDGRLIGVVRSRAREVRRGVRLFINPRRSRVFRHIKFDLLIDLPASKVSVTPDGIVVDTTTQNLRNRLQYNRRLDEDARVFL